MTITVQVAMWAVGIIFVGGGMYADVRTRLGRMEKMLGNGSPGVFVRHEELEQMVKSADEAHVRLHARDDELASRLQEMQSGR